MPQRAHGQGQPALHRAARGDPGSDPPGPREGRRMSADDPVIVAADATLSPDSKAKAPRTVTGYSIPGEGSSTLISIVTVVSLLALWWIATHAGWIRDIFLPTPERILTAFGDAWRGDIQGGKPLQDHLWASLYRVFAAFLL